MDIFIEHHFEPYWLLLKREEVQGIRFFVFVPNPELWPSRRQRRQDKPRRPATFYETDWDYCSSWSGHSQYFSAAPAGRANRRKT